MNLDEQWKKLDKEQDNELSGLLDMPVINRLSSKDPLEKIKRSLLMNGFLGLLISAIYILIIIRFPFWQIIICIGIVLLFTVWAVAKALLLYGEMKKTVTGNSLLQEMQRHYENIQKWMTVQQHVGLVIYPVAAAGGFMLGGFLGSGKPIGYIMRQPVMIVALLIAIAVLVPACFYLAKWMCNRSFGKYTRQLKINIDMLKQEE